MRLIFPALFLCVIPATIQAACHLPDPHLRTDTTLEAGCIYHQTLVIDRPLTLDCQGAILDGEDRLARGLQINSRGMPLSDVLVRNCTFRHFVKQGILVHWSLPADKKIARYSKEERYRRSPQNILFSQIHIEHNGEAGIVLDDYVQNVVMDRISVSDNEGWGLYWDHDSRGHLLINSELRRNGHKNHKQALAIDASSNNRIINNLFENNARSAIQLYRNCWEFAATNPHSVPRETGANDNIISGNLFIGEQVGVWIAARMSQNLSAMQCGRLPYHQGKYFEDEARRNLISNNRFSDTKDRSIVVEDDFNSVIGNSFTKSDRAIQIGAPIRAQTLGLPVQGTQLHGNRADDDGNPVRILDSISGQVQ